MTKLVALVATLTLSAIASAQPNTLKLDPSGAPQCFTPAGAKAPLASCPAQATYVSASDPSGAAQCFTSAGAKAPLASCDLARPAFVLQADPTGAPMCFTHSGAKAPLADCGALAGRTASLGTEVATR